MLFSNAVHCLLWESFQTNEYTVCAKLLIIKAGGTYSYNWDVKG
jgi:hypothetical protein